MNHKVLLADDSLTIQKVIKITLANQPYDITDCSSEDELFQKLPVVQPKIVFLDFNLSEKFTGYELTSRIKSISPSTKVLLLLGTFDSVDDASLEKCGASDKIVKPFDSNKFIAICKQLAASDSENDDLAYPEISSEPELAADPDDQWTMTASKDMSLERAVMETPKQPEPLATNALDKEISDWGMSVPGIINDKSSHDIMIDLPPVIETGAPSIAKDSGKTKVAPASPVSDAVYPSNDDLDYPDMGSSEPVKPEPARSSATSKLISIETFNEQPEIELEKFPTAAEESDVSSIEAQIRDEVEDDLWKADEFEDLKREVSDKISSIKSDFQPTMNDFDEALFKPLDEHESIKWSNEEPVETKTLPSSGVPAASVDQLRSEMEAMVKKYVKEYMDQMFKQNVEKVSWEVIPDLAENLIRQELNKISSKIINDQ